MYKQERSLLCPDLMEQDHKAKVLKQGGSKEIVMTINHLNPGRTKTKKVG